MVNVPMNRVEEEKDTTITLVQLVLLNSSYILEVTYMSRILFEISRARCVLVLALLDLKKA